MSTVVSATSCPDFPELAQVSRVPKRHSNHKSWYDDVSSGNIVKGKRRRHRSRKANEALPYISWIICKRIAKFRHRQQAAQNRRAVSNLLDFAADA
jgi:hypothetical protein